ncbi:MAG: PIN/TRAM domain-containing protein [Planctomycetota bacterium]
MILFILRGLVVVIVATISVGYLLANQESGGIGFQQFMLLLVIAMVAAGAVIAADAFSPKKKLSAISGVFLGLIAGLIVLLPLAYIVDLIGVLSQPPEPAPAMTLTETYTQVQSEMLSLVDIDQMTQEQLAELHEEARITATARFDRATRLYGEAISRLQTQKNLLLGVKVILGVITCYICISLVLQTKDDFRFIIPYVEFAKQVRGNRPIILDTSVIVDGRVLDIIDTQVMQGVIIVPRFVLDELQTIADSSDKIKRARGRRGLDILQKLQANDKAEVHVEDREAEGVNVDQKLIDLSAQMQGRLMTNDFNLNKIATLRGVDVINLNDLAKALRPVVLPGEHLTVKLVKPGESSTQGVGYLEDGTMVVVENGRTHLDHLVDLVVTSTLQTSAGRMIFGKFAHEEDEKQAASGQPKPKASGETPAPKQEATPAAKPTPTKPAADAGPPPQRPRGTSSRRNPRRG